MQGTARNFASEISVQAVKITADGRRVPLGTVDYWSRNPLKRLWWTLFGRLLNKLKVR